MVIIGSSRYTGMWERRATSRREVVNIGTLMGSSEVEGTCTEVSLLFHLKGPLTPIITKHNFEAILIEILSNGIYKDLETFGHSYPCCARDATAQKSLVSKPHRSLELEL